MNKQIIGKYENGYPYGTVENGYADSVITITVNSDCTFMEVGTDKNGEIEYCGYGETWRDAHCGPIHYMEVLEQNGWRKVA